MAKSSRASTVKTNNQRLKANVFGPVEQARMERLSAKLLEVAAAPKPPRPEPSEMKIVDKAEEQAEDNAADETMEIDSKPAPATRTSGRITKKKKKNSKIVFPKYGDRKKTGFSTKNKKTA
ncbi:hypothetical protein BKA67DRAFT_535235 [Truncatella angustata]|uniref:DUF2423 domain-containing protein n=1 Tax=Truncatella angustata TaxID=152316 RepID=A0A9P8UKP9_9PEZI|nr:uncharacterized protein BKA67DRAFT_535235 [Truncatella angustata]KAH6653889.1 hypothetical protein BKA67DRAFT_535235 [Truncatella angustata]KAH8196615.1 hypothetical protein TruAng_009209 [Truncatella angustata]